MAQMLDKILGVMRGSQGRQEYLWDLTRLSDPKSVPEIARNVRPDLDEII